MQWDIFFEFGKKFSMAGANRKGRFGGFFAMRRRISLNIKILDCYVEGILKQQNFCKLVTDAILEFGNRCCLFF